MGTIPPFFNRQGTPGANRSRQIGFDRVELNRILDLYGHMVAAGHWRDYAMNFELDFASFSAFLRTAERPEYRIEKRPALRIARACGRC